MHLFFGITGYVVAFGGGLVAIFAFVTLLFRRPVKANGHLRNASLSTEEIPLEILALVIGLIILGIGVGITYYLGPPSWWGN